jgi:hypothetical protein
MTLPVVSAPHSYWLSKYPGFAAITDRDAMYGLIVDQKLLHGFEYRYNVPYNRPEVSVCA